MATESKRPQGLRERNKAEKLARIRAAADRLFTTQGFDRTTIEQIAREADVAKGTVFLYAKDKRELLMMVFMDRIRSRMGDSLMSLPESPVLEQILHLFEAFMRHYATVPALARLFIREAVFLEGNKGQEYHDLTEGYILLMAGLLRQAQERDEVRPDLDLRLAAQNIFGAYAMTLMDWLGQAEPDIASGLARLRSALTLIFQGMEAGRD